MWLKCLTAHTLFPSGKYTKGLAVAEITNNYILLTDGIKAARNPFYGIYSETNWEKTSAADFWNLRRACLENPLRSTGASSGTIVYQGVKYGSHLPKTIVDYIETDY